MDLTIAVAAMLFLMPLLGSVAVAVALERCEFRGKPATYSEMKPAGGSELMPATHSDT